MLGEVSTACVSGRSKDSMIRRRYHQALEICFAANSQGSLCVDSLTHPLMQVVLTLDSNGPKPLG